MTVNGYDVATVSKIQASASLTAGGRRVLAKWLLRCPYQPLFFRVHKNYSRRFSNNMLDEIIDSLLVQNHFKFIGTVFTSMLSNWNTWRRGLSPHLLD